MGLNKKGLLVFAIILSLFSTFAAANTDVLDVTITEYVSQITAYDQVYGPNSEEPTNLVEAPGELGENRTTGTFSRTGVELQDTEIYGVINITNTEIIGNLTLVSVNVTLNNTYNITQLNYVTRPSYLGVSDINVSVDMATPGSPNNISIFIPELRANDSVVINYTVAGIGVGEPLNFTEFYSFWRVLTGRTINVTLNVTNQFVDDVLIFDLTLTKTPFPHPDVFNDWSYFNFTNLRGEDANNATIIWNGSASILQWNASDRDLAQNETRQIIFDATAPQNLTINYSGENDWGMWLQMGNISADFKMNGSVSGIRLTEIVSVPADSRMAVTKERINESFYWNSSANLTNDAAAPVDYNLTILSVWATKISEYTNPGNISTWVNETNTTASGYGLLSGQTYANATWILNLPWTQGQSIDNYSILFNYSYVPIVWADASFIILDNGTQYFKLNESRSAPGGYLFVEEVYVLLGGYLMKVTKQLTPMEDAVNANRYLINITLENIGTERTPDLVTMFDMLPADFNPLIYASNATTTNRNMTSGNQILRVTTQQGTWSDLTSNYVRGAEDTGLITSGAFTGYHGYNMDFQPINASSNGDGIYTKSNPSTEIGIAYKLEGNNSLVRIENAYIVGVDPIRLEGASPSQSVASRLKVTSRTLEYLVVLVSLVVSIGLLSVGFMYSRKK
jgi:hypothetical protein